MKHLMEFFFLWLSYKQKNVAAFTDEIAFLCVLIHTHAFAVLVKFFSRSRPVHEHT